MSEHWGDTISRLPTLPHALSEFVHWPQLCIPSWGSSIWERPTKGAQITQILNDWHTDVHLLWGLRTLILWPIEKLLGIWLHGHKLWRTTLGCLMSAKCQAVLGAGCEGETVRLLCFCAAHCQVLMLCRALLLVPAARAPWGRCPPPDAEHECYRFLTEDHWNPKYVSSFFFISNWVKFTGIILGIKAQRNIIIFICTYIFIGMSWFIAWGSLIFHWCPNSESRLQISFFSYFLCA